MKLKAVLFDLDGTLLDTSDDLYNAVTQVLRLNKLPLIKRESFNPLITDGITSIIKNACESSAEPLQFPLLLEQFFALYEARIAVNTAPFPGIELVLASIAEYGLSWGIITDKYRRFTLPLIDQLGLEPKVVICPEDVTESKPSPKGLLKACKQLDLLPQQAIYIGDHQRDIKTAKNATMRSVAVTYGFTSLNSSPPHWQADYLIDEAIELIPIISKLL